MIHVFKQVQVLPIGPKAAWNFFSRPENLNDITPPDMGFKVLSTLPEKVYPGLMIAYKIKLFGFVPFDWLTEITHVNDPFFFVDEQRIGPYALWHHEHHFTETDNGVEMTDIVHYKPPYGILGSIMNSIFIRPQLEKIFHYRKKALERIFPAK